MTLTLRPANLHTDLPGIWEIFHRVVQGGDTYVHSPDAPIETCRDYWFGPDKTPFVAVDENSPLSILGVYVLRPNHPDLGAHVANASYMVHPDTHGRGIGRQMGEHSIVEAKRQGYQAMQFNIVISTNRAAVKLWQSLGFTIIGTSPKAFQHQTLGLVDTFIMHRFV